MKRITRILFGILCGAALMLTGIQAGAVQVTFRVDMSEETISPLGVHIAGNFQGWNPDSTEMTASPFGAIYSYTVDLIPGEVIEWKYINGNEWGMDEAVPGGCAQNGNRYLTVPDEDIVLSIVCFGKCTPCNPPEVDITFQVDMSNQTVSPNGVHIAGDFQGWDPDTSQMQPIGNNVYAITFNLESGGYYEYKFLNGNAWGTDETVPQECANGWNRYIYVPDVPTTLDAVCFGSCYPCGPPPVDVEITFQVDMSLETIHSEGVHIAGGFQGWDPGATPMVDAGNGIYTYTTILPSGTYQEYKFINGNDWPMAENLPPECSVNNNRYFTVPDVDTTLDLVCYGMCTACPQPVDVEVTFQVDMSEETVSPDGVHLAGSFNGFDPAATPMTDQGNGVYAVTLTLTENDDHMYKFVNGNTFAGFEVVPPECSQEDGNRELTVPGVNTTLDLVCFGSCEPCVPPPTVNVTFRVDMSLEDVSADGVHIAGSFQGWDPAATPLTETGGGIYTVTLPLEAGTHQIFKYINGVSFDFQESVPEACGEPDGFGGYNRYLDVPANDTILDLVCFSRCTACPSPVEVTFQVDMQNEAVSPDGVFIAGSFNGWNTSGDQMTLLQDDIYTFTTTLYTGDYHEYKFINGNAASGYEEVPAGCAANENRYLTVPGENTTLDLVCFGSCTVCAPPTVEVTFQVDMSNETVSPDGVFIAGSFQGWVSDATPMTLTVDNIYTYTATLNANEYYEYKFLNGSEYENVPGECSQNGNRYLTAPEVNTTLDLVCFGRCDTCPPLVDITFQVDMSNETVSPEGVHIAGSFNGFDPAATGLTDLGDGIWAVTMTLAGGDHHTFKYINGNSYDFAETVPEACGEPDGFGGFNRYLDVPGENAMLDLVCFGSCTACAFDHVIQLTAGWNGLSSYRMPAETNIEALMSQIFPELVIMQNMDGIYYPDGGVNTLQTWESQSAYKIKVTEDVTLTITGPVEQNKTLQLNEGWNLIPVISEEMVDVEALFSGTEVEVVKGVAELGVYWPAYNINTLGMLIPGKAFFVRMGSADSITFP